jgi:peptidoglycan hydrolase CwlO-like protein
MSERSARRLLYRQKRTADREDCNHNRVRNRGHDVKRNLVARNGSPEGHRVEALETHIAALKEVVANAKAEIEQTRQKADALSSQVAEQSAANDKLQAELDNLRAGINAYW